MKKNLALIIISVLFLIFIITWITKANNTQTRNNNTEQTNVDWYNQQIKTIPDDEWTLDPEIPENYIPVPGEIETYMVIDTTGNIIEYRNRKKDSSGTWNWTTLEKINNNKTYDVVSNSENKDIIKITDNSNNTSSYIKYIRNEDNSFAYVDCDENGNTESPIGSDIPNNYLRVSGNVYAIYNEHGVITGYKERFVNDNGEFYWVDVEKPEENNENIQNTNTNNTVSGNIEIQTGNSDGSSVSINTYRETKTVDNYIITYETIITKTYDNEGNLISTKKDGPYEVDRTLAIGNNITNDSSKIALTLDGEVYRISNGLNFNTDLANSVLNELNNERKTSGLNELSMDNNSNLYKLAKCKASDMALNNHSNSNSDLYGTLKQLGVRFGINLSNTSESLFKTIPMNSIQIHSRMQAISNSREARMSSSISQIAIVIVEYNGYQYIYECYN